jgi:hypothetical protein
MVRSIPAVVFCLILAATLYGCRDMATAPSADATKPSVAPTLVYPMEDGGDPNTEVTAEFWRDSLTILIHRDRSVLGTQFQAMVNADLLPTGYGDGYDYVLRGPEVREDGTFPIRLCDPLNDDNPGGWGEIVGTGQAAEHGQRLRIRVAQSTLGGTTQAQLEVQLTREGAMVFEWVGGAGTPQTGIARADLGPRVPVSRLPRSR